MIQMRAEELSTEALIAEINTLAKKKKEQGLTGEETKRQKELYAVYLKGFRNNFKQRLDNMDVRYPDGTVRSLKEAMEVGKKNEKI